jgi:hypothetical protein
VIAKVDDLPAQFPVDARNRGSTGPLVVWPHPQRRFPWTPLGFAGHAATGFHPQSTHTAYDRSTK